VASVPGTCSTKQLLKRWLTPPGLYPLLWRALLARRHAPTRAERSELSRNAEFKDKHRGERCYVLGNGPSLNAIDLEKLRDQTTICMNNFGEHPILKTGWQPTYFCVVDVRSRRSDADSQAKIEANLEGISPQAIFYPIDFQPFLDRHNVFFLKMASLHIELWPGAPPLDLTATIPGLHCSEHLAIVLALWMGFAEIILLGMDHDWLTYRSWNKHFYEYSGSEDDVDFGTIPYGTMIAATHTEWQTYKHFLRVAAVRQVSIVNASPGSYLDVFSPVDFASLQV